MRNARVGIGGVCRWVSLGLPVFIAGHVGAAIINYGDFVGNQVIFVGVTESSGEPVPLYGPPNVAGDSLDFNPIGFEASSTGPASDLTVGNLAFMVRAKPGNFIKSLNLSEAGDTTLAGNVPLGSTGTATAAFTSGVLDIQEVDFGGINQISVPFSMTFSPSGGTYFLGTDGGGGPIFHTQFNGTVTLPVEQILIANNVPFINGATKISVNLNNSLSAVSETGTSALIAKKDFGGLVITVPEPTTVVGLAALGVLVLSRRRC